jgi:hypothetical protein
LGLKLILIQKIYEIAEQNQIVCPQQRTESIERRRRCITEIHKKLEEAKQYEAMYDSQINDKNLIDAKKLEQYLEKAIELYINIVAEM